MSRPVRDARIETPTARAKLARSETPYWRGLDVGLHLGYRAGKEGGRWVVRRRLGSDGKRYESATLPGIADDRQACDGVNVLNFVQAQAAARSWFGAVLPAAAKAMTVRAACEGYVAYLRAEKKTGDDAKNRLARWVLPTLGDKIVAELTTPDIEGVMRAMAVSKSSVNRSMNSLRAALNRAFYDPANAIPSDAAWRRVKNYRNADRVRDVFLDPKQVSELIRNCDGALKNLVIAALLTGARPPHELAAMRARDFDRDLGTLVVPSGKTGRRIVTLTSEATDWFATLAAGKAADDLLLPMDDGSAWGHNNHSVPMKAAVARAKLPEGTTIYTCRHTHASQALLNGCNIKLLSDNLGTSILMIEKHYGKFLASSRRAMVEATGPKLGLVAA